MRIEMKARNGVRLEASRPLRELFRLNDEEFLDAAYVALLGREPDPKGREHYLRRLAFGGSRIETLRDLRGSPEGRAKRVLSEDWVVAQPGRWWHRLPFIRAFTTRGPRHDRLLDAVFTAQASLDLQAQSYLRLKAEVTELRESGSARLARTESDVTLRTGRD
jgi:hypothetical protein